MIKAKILTLVLASLVMPAWAGVHETTLTEVLQAVVPDHSRYTLPKVDKVTINDQKKLITVKCTESTTYVPLTLEQIDALKASMLEALPKQYAAYKLNIVADGHPLEDLASDAKLTLIGPKETQRFITPLDAVAAPQGLDGHNIAMWQSHGWYFEPKLNRWEWQRARIFQTVEDLYTQSYVMPFLMPMLQNAGAYVMSPRERDVRTEEIIIDNDAPLSGYAESNGSRQWQGAGTGFGHDGSVLTEGVNPFRGGTARSVAAVSNAEMASTASWSADIPERGDYAVYVSYASLPNSATDAVYTVNAANGPRRYKVNQRMGGGTWIYLGHFTFDEGRGAKPLVELSNVSATDGAVVSADAVKIGGGVGNVARMVKVPVDDIDYQYQVSDYPRFTQGARYWLQWAGAPDSVYTPSNNENDYTDDYRSRGLWVNWLTGGSSMLPQSKGLGIPIDLSFAFHTDAGTTPNDEIIGTLGIYCTESKAGKYANGTSRLAARKLTNDVMTHIADDARATFEPNWSRRGMWDKSYAEARAPEVPAMLLELLSHQNFADMKYGLDPTFRFMVSRAIYKGMLDYLGERDGRQYMVQPLPVKNFAISGGKDGRYTLSWAETVDTLASASPTYYIIEERVGDAAGFSRLAIVDEGAYDVVVTDSHVRSYRVIAGNDGGVSFPSEVLALCYKPGAKQVLVVNGFTRVSGPDWFDSGEIAGFYDVRDHGVPYVQDISFIGSQFEFRREIPWMDDDAAGFGASRSNYETEVVAGNTFDYASVHGQAIAQAGYGFVSTSVDAYVAADRWADIKVVDLIMGKQKEVKTGTGLYGTRFKTFTAPLQQKLRKHAEAGGSIFVSGSFIATDLWDNPYSTPEVMEADKKFAAEVLGYNWRVGQASVTGEAHEVPSRFRQFSGGDFEFCNELNSDLYAVESPDSFYAADKNGATIMRYTENNLVAGTAYDNGHHRTVALGFPFETIISDSSRTALITQILKFLTK